MVESKTNKMVLVWSRQDKIFKTKWHHSCQIRWLPVSYDTLVQEGDYLRHAWQGGVFRISAHVTWADKSVEVEYPRISPLGIPQQLIKGLNIYQDTQKGGLHGHQGYNWGRLQTTADTANPHTPRGCSTLCWSSDCPAARGSALLDQNFVCPTANPALQVLPV